MGMHESRIGNLCVAITESSPRPRSDASAEIVVRVLKSAADQAGGSPWNPYVIARVDLLVRRDPSEFPSGQLLTPAAEAAVVDAVKGFLERNRAAQQPVAAPAKPSETAAANPNNV